MIYKIKYWIPIIGIILFYVDFLDLHNIDINEKYPFFSLYHIVFLFFAGIFFFNCYININIK